MVGFGVCSRWKFWSFCRVKFGVPIASAFTHDIPATLLVSLHSFPRFKRGEINFCRAFSESASLSSRELSCSFSRQPAHGMNAPGVLQVLLLKVNKEGPLKKDIWRAPGNQAQVRKLAHVMQHGRLVNIANFSVYTAASVIKVGRVSLACHMRSISREWRSRK